MPDLLAHYLVSYLIARTIVEPRYALIIAFVGLFPDVDALLGVHRWVTHSVLVALLASTPLLALAYLSGGRYVKVVLLALLLYTLHLVLDLFTGPTPILYPLVGSIWVKLKVIGLYSDTGIALTPRVTVETTKPDFTPQPAIEGPIVSEVGIILAVVTALVLVLEYLGKKMSVK
uniref:Metal-dependent hydrolase n=1 Tax=Ignisphaera aggregans TaxID=334771 RepID=A0A7J3Z5T6_9CREN